ncbi:uncharacterized protein LOC123531432 isoform X2 [Mercenaria mercenaria]|uniref:uncharacterized protein LOC123531432 isoform X2 n=1 Tax=Mercenaria mercenaria TaxID=6596 RepID=UPI00234F9D94|nr:uncharacterized protein LOC123531432 isoform X2 [Mercenaria mercenaria]
MVCSEMRSLLVALVILFHIDQVRMVDGEMTNKTSEEYINNDATIDFMDYALMYGGVKKHRWIIQFPVHRFVRIAFTNVSMMLSEDCSDSLLISKEINSKKGRQIDHRFNGRQFVVETSENRVYLTFVPCPLPEIDMLIGFSAVITSEVVPACLTVNMDKPWGDGRKESCNKPEMILTSMSILNLPFVGVQEKWEIRAGDHHSIQLNFIDFYVICPEDPEDKVSKFVVVDYPPDCEREYCSSFGPLDVIRSETSTVMIKFRQRRSKKKGMVRTEGFRLHYSSVNHSLENITSTRNPELDEACSETFGRCYRIFHQSKPKNWKKAKETCEKHNLLLVSVKSRYEMQYINYLLRNSRYKTKARLKGDPLAHIGLRRSGNQGKKTYVWENDSPVFYSAWEYGYPLEGEDCTATNFERFVDDTWKSLHCSTAKASYFVCMSQIKNNGVSTSMNEKDFCEDAIWKNYLRINVTYSGAFCESSGAHKAKEKVSEKMSHGPKTQTEYFNYCQDTYSSGIFECYTKHNKKEPCFLQLTSPQEQADGRYRAIDSRTFQCEDGEEILWFNKCDGSFDCLDFSDETLCFNTLRNHPLVHEEDAIQRNDLPERLDNTSYYRCRNMEWISILARCDGIIDCVDASDEIDCPGKDDCSETEFSCGDGNCINVGQVCDFFSDCSDSRDEFCEFGQCDEDEEHTCDNLQCISLDKRCNAHTDCIDGSDERECDQCINSFLCDGNKCIPDRLVGDKVNDCEDGSDEIGKDSSCDKLRELGYNSENNSVGNYHASCDFSSVNFTAGETQIQFNMDISINDRPITIFVKTNDRSSYELTSTSFQNILSAEYDCEFKIRSTCKLPIEASLSLLQYNSSDVLHNYCRCLDWTYRYSPELLTYELYNSETCDGNNNTMSYLDDPLQQMRRGIETEKMPNVITPGTLTCTLDCSSNVTENTIYCEKEKNRVPGSLLCVYDIDEYGYMKGCRSGSHLQNCGSFVCPKNTVKCPGSYCILRRFICDETKHCPGGEDEQNCTCSDSSKEIVILIEDTRNQTGRVSKLAAVNLAEQLYTPGSIIRMLYYKTKTPLKKFPLKHKLMKIKEERIFSLQGKKHRASVCKYNSMARNLLQSLRFSDRKLIGFVFIEDSVDSSSVAELMFSNVSQSTFVIYRVLKSEESKGRESYRFVKDIHIAKWEALFSIGYRRFPEICEEASTVPCSGGYRCSTSKQCIPVEQVCDGTAHCTSGDDERLCGYTCLHNCTCNSYSVNCRAANLVHTDAMDMSTKTRSADLSMNPDLKDILTSENLRFPFMIRLNLSACQIGRIDNKAFSSLYNLVSLDIGYNEITKITGNVFQDLIHLRDLNLNGNIYLRKIFPTAFRTLKRLKNLQIVGTSLKRISAYTFSDLNMKTIDISNNGIEEIEDYAFNNTSVQKINMEGNRILTFHKLIFYGVESLQELRTPAYKFCCVRPCYVNESECYPKQNEFSSCGDLIRHPALQATLWLVGIFALVGNLGAIVYRLVYDRERLKIGYGIFVTNLAGADFLMGVYLIIIAVVDSLYRQDYISNDEQWRNSYWCVSAGVLSTVSSEASVLFVCLITLDRLLVIKYPFGNVRLGPKKAYVCCVVSWTVACALALVPVIFTDYFKNKFYSRTGVCIALPLTRDKPPGWMYSVIIFVGLNFCTFVLVAVGQLSIFMELRKANSSIRKTQRARRTDLKVARNLILVATTDFLCWFPIGVMGLMALGGHPIPGDVYAWTAIFILPLNSALNPVLYTLTAIIGKQEFSPSTDEQDRTDIKMHIGTELLRFEDLSRTIRKKRNIASTATVEVRSIHDILQDGCIPVSTAAAIGLQLSKYLCLLHEASITVDHVSENNTYVEKQMVSLILDWKSSLTGDEKKMQDNMHQFGTLLRRLIGNRR